MSSLLTQPFARYLQYPGDGLNQYESTTIYIDIDIENN
jgi:hypothetical protein